MEPKRIELDTFSPRYYQIDLFEKMEKEGKKKVVLVWHRRAGKDLACFYFTVRSALRRVGLYAYLLPTATMARKVIFDGLTLDGKRILDLIPRELIRSINVAQMKVTLKNGSVILFSGSDQYNSLRGQNIIGAVLSEYAYMHPMVYPTIRPAILASDGWVIFISTPQADNHFKAIWDVAQNFPDEWFSQMLTINDTGVMSWEDVLEEVARGEISLDMAHQEYLCSFSTGAHGSYYSRYLNTMELNGQITTLNYDPSYKCYSAWDIGVNDLTVIIIFQIIDRRVNIIEVYHNNNVGQEHYIHYIQSKQYIWGGHIGPHDLKAREYGNGAVSRLERAAELGVEFIIAPAMSFHDGVECVRTILPRVYIDQDKASFMVKALRNYRKKYDAEHGVYTQTPVRDLNAHFADALRYLCITLPSLRQDESAEELHARYMSARYGKNKNMGFFSD